MQLAIEGMDCAECAQHIERGVRALPGIHRAEVLLGAERLDAEYDPAQVQPAQIASAVVRAGYRVRSQETPPSPARPLLSLASRLGWLFAGLLSLVVAIELIGERLGLFEALLDRIPGALVVGVILLGGFPIFLNVVRALWRRQITAHALMTLGILGALATGELLAAAVIVFFMRMADFLEGFTTERSRQAIRSLMSLAPPSARLLSEGGEQLVPAESLQVGQRILVRPGERCPADGTVERGAAAVDQSPITGESMPLDKGPGQEVYAGTIVHGGALEVRVIRTGADTTLGRIVRLVEEAEAHKAPVQRLADRFTGWYIPVVVSVAALTYLLSRNLSAAMAVLLVACACAVALATPTAVLASVGRAAREGILIKGGRYLELLARADTLLMDKTGTLTLGRPAIVEVLPLDGRSRAEVLRLAAIAECYSEHPVASAVRAAARESELLVGNRRLLEARGLTIPPDTDGRIAASEAAGRTVFYVAWSGRLAGALAVADTLRPEAIAALDALRGLGFRQMLLLTGDNDRSARAMARALGVEYRADLLPEDKIRVVREFQSSGRVVLMLGDGVNDAPALAQADVGMAMGAAATDAALEAAPIALMGDDWSAVPKAVRISRRTFRVIQQNLALGVLYNVLGLSLAALGLLPPVAAAAAQSIPDLLIMLSSARLLRR